MVGGAVNGLRQKNHTFALFAELSALICRNAHPGLPSEQTVPRRFGQLWPRTEQRYSVWLKNGSAIRVTPKLSGGRTLGE